jgi:hypothetical protein
MQGVTRGDSRDLKAWRAVDWEAREQQTDEIGRMLAGLRSTLRRRMACE